MWSFFIDHFNGHAEGLRDDQDVTEDNGGVEEAGIALDRLEGDCGSNFRVAADGEEVACAFCLVVFWGVVLAVGMWVEKESGKESNLGGSGQLDVTENLSARDS